MCYSIITPPPPQLDGPFIASCDPSVSASARATASPLDDLSNDVVCYLIEAGNKVEHEILTNENSYKSNLALRK